MKLFSLDWFRANKEKEKEVVIPVSEIRTMEEVIKNPKPYKKVNLVGEVLTVVMLDGSVLTKVNCTETDYYAVLASLTVSDILTVIVDKEILARKTAEDALMESKKNLVKGFELLGNFNDFTIEDNVVYLKGINRSLPELLVAKFAEILGSYSVYSVQQTEEFLLKNEAYQALKRFFMWCCLNPRAEVADQLYEFLMKNDFKITKQGFFVALRNVEKVNNAEAHDYVNFISNAYNKIKTVWKKKPSDYAVYKDDEDQFYFTKITDMPKDETMGHEVVGNLKDLYLNLPNAEENRYTDAYTHTFDIRIGQKVWMDPAKCSWSTADCAEAGLHFAGHTAPYVLCGNTTIFTLHNPMKVVGIGTEKGRCWEYLPFMTTTVKEADAIMTSNDFDFLQLDEKYAIDELEGLAEKVKAGFIAETSKHEFNLPQISTENILTIVNSLQSMKEEISNRISLIK